MTTKVCTKCGEEKHLDGFHKQKRGKFGRTSQCIECERARGKRRYAAEVTGVSRHNGCRSPDSCKAIRPDRLCRGCQLRVNASQPEARAKISNRLRRLWAQKDYRDNMIQILTRNAKDPNLRADNSRRMRERHRDPEFSSARDERFIAMIRDPEMQAVIREAKKKGVMRMHADTQYKSELKRRKSKLMQEMNDDPKFRQNRQKKLHLHAEYRAFMKRLAEEEAEWLAEQEKVATRANPVHPDNDNVIPPDAKTA